MTVSHLDAVGQVDHGQASVIAEEAGVATVLCSLMEDVNCVV